MDIRSEESRMHVLHSLGVLDVPEEERFDRIVELARRVFGVPYAAVNLIDGNRQWSKARSGLRIAREVRREDSICATTIEGSGALIVNDARSDERFSHIAGVTGDPNIRFYAGQPLSVRGERVGALCIVDQIPGGLTSEQQELLSEFGRWAELELARSEEMEQAAEVQRRLLPSSSPDIAGLEVSGRCVQASAVGGDFFDWFVTGDELQITLADVMGKGLSAALHAATVRATLRTAGRLFTPTETMRIAEESMTTDLEASGTFATVFLARIDPEDGAVEYVDAGHGLGFVLEASGTLRPLSDQQPPLGLDLAHTWQSRHTRLAPGDTLIAVSDGFLDLFADTQEATAAAISLGKGVNSAEEMVRNAIQFAVDLLPRDDVSVVAVRRTP